MRICIREYDWPTFLVNDYISTIAKAGMAQRKLRESERNVPGNHCISTIPLQI